MTESKKFKILIVDDQKSILMTLTSILENHGYATTAVDNAADAIYKLDSEPFDLLLTDAIMPNGGTGYDLIRTIRNHPRLSKLPALLLTGKREKEDIMKGLACGASDYLVKPIDDQILISKIKKFLNSSNETQDFLTITISDEAEFFSKPQIIGISELGIRFQSQFTGAQGLHFRLKAKIFDEIGIPHPLLKLSTSEFIDTSKGFIMEAEFIGLSEKERTPLRLWLRKKVLPT